MTIFPPETKQRLLNATKESAAAFIEDVAHVRNVLKPENINRGEIRRLSSVLRRFLVDYGGDISSLAPARIGCLKLHCPDNNPIYATARKTPFQFFGSGCGEDFKVFGDYMRALGVRDGMHPRHYANFEPNKLVYLSHDGFLSNNVLCLQGKWISRRSVIRYVANVASGVHSQAPKDDTDKIISNIRNCVTYSQNDGKLHTLVNLEAIKTPSNDFSYSAYAINPVLFELICAAHYFVTSPDVVRLEKHIHNEIGIA